MTETRKDINQKDRLTEPEKRLDSEVFMVKNEKGELIVEKRYTNLTEDLGDALVKEVLHNYKQDTKRAEELLRENPNPLNQSITFRGQNFLMNYVIVNQGNHVNAGNLNEVVVISGQQFIEGSNLEDLSFSNLNQNFDSSDDFSDLAYQNRELYRKLKEYTLQVFGYLNQKLDTHFTFAPMNVKTQINYQKGTIDVFVTDLGSSLNDYYRFSPRLQSLREKYPGKAD